MRQATVRRATLETDIEVTLGLDGEGVSEIDSGIGFFDHMLTALAKYAKVDIQLAARGDLDVDGHHTVEDCGLVLGDALAQAVGDKRGIRRAGHSMLPMDEALAICALDISGRPYTVLSAQWPAPMIGSFDSQLVEEFFRAFATRAGITLHLRVEGKNAHHMAEALYKAVGFALRDALEADPRERGIPSTKGAL